MNWVFGGGMKTDDDCIMERRPREKGYLLRGCWAKRSWGMHYSRSLGLGTGNSLVAKLLRGEEGSRLVKVRRWKIFIRVR